jgi:hypothetical protein
MARAETTDAQPHPITSTIRLFKRLCSCFHSHHHPLWIFGSCDLVGIVSNSELDILVVEQVIVHDQVLIGTPHLHRPVDALIVVVLTRP